jgi:integrase
LCSAGRRLYNSSKDHQLYQHDHRRKDQTLKVPRKRYEGSSLATKAGKLRLRWRTPDGVRRSFASHLPDTPHNRDRLAPLVGTVGMLVRAGTDPLPTLRDFFTRRVPVPPEPAGPTLAEYIKTVFLPYHTVPHVRKAQAKDYRRHLAIVCKIIGSVRVAALEPAHIRTVQTVLLGEGKSSKYVKNILTGSLRAVINLALEDKVLVDSPFPRRLKWPRWRSPEPDPLTPEERERICGWFQRRQYAPRRSPHPPFYVYVHMLFWTGLRPSEASGLEVQDFDSATARLHVRQSRHLYEVAEPKTRSANRWIELHPETARLLRDILPLHVTPDAPLFVNLDGRPLEPKRFSEHWYRCLRALGIRQRGLYCTKDTFVTTSLQAGVRIAWLEAQTGVNYATLRRHYGKWITLEGTSEWARFQGELDPAWLSGGPIRRKSLI